MKCLILLFLFTVLFSSCTTMQKMSNEAIHYAIVGKNMKVVGDRLGLPSQITNAPNNEKIMIYEAQSQGLSYYTSNSNGSMQNVSDKPKSEGGITINPSASASSTPTTNNYASYEKIWYFKVYINDKGICYKTEENLTPEQLDEYYERFKQYVPKK